uniref:LITAF domain-containing protein n=1 Tax=Panagrolaimus sp. ES5 TaxID=591445 RepID=A0AC34GTW8_9BILA
MSNSNKTNYIPVPEASAPPPPYESVTNNSNLPQQAEINETKYTPDFTALPPPPPYESKQNVKPTSTRATVFVPSNTTFDAEPVIMTCPNCQKLIETNINHTVGLLSWLGCLGCVLLDCTAGCCLLPFCIKGCKDVEHYCSNCKSFLGKYKRLG